MSSKNAWRTHKMGLPTTLCAIKSQRPSSHTQTESYTRTLAHTDMSHAPADWGAKLRIVPENATKNTEYPAALAWAPKAFHTISWPEQIEVQSVLWKRLKLGRSQHKKQRKAVTPQHPPAASLGTMMSTAKFVCRLETGPCLLQVLLYHVYSGS